MISKNIRKLLNEINRLKKKYEEPGQKCNSGHTNTLPISLWDCPICTDKLRKENEWLINQYTEILWDYTKTGTKVETKEAIVNEMQHELNEK